MCVLLVVVVGGGVVVNHQIKLLFESCTQLTAVFFFFLVGCCCCCCRPGVWGYLTQRRRRCQVGTLTVRERERECVGTQSLTIRNDERRRRRRQLRNDNYKREEAGGRGGITCFFFPSISPFLEFAPPSPPPTFIYAQKQLYFSFYSPTHTHTPNPLLFSV